MLTRVSNNLFWLSRYIERVENLARIADTTYKDSIEIESNNPSYESHNQIWKPIFNNLGYDKNVINNLINDKQEDIIFFINFSLDNKFSILNCISQARENARLVRDQISEEIWRELNRFHLMINSSQNNSNWNHNPADFYRKVIDFCMLLSGLINSTILHDEGWNFLQIGKHIERADKTLRILQIFNEKGTNNSNSISSTLRSATAYSSYLSATKGTFNAKSIYRFLLFAPSFPRSVRYCFRQLEYFLHQISGSPIGSSINPVEQSTHNIVAKIDFYNTQTTSESELIKYLEPLIRELAKIGQELFDDRNYALPRIHDIDQIQSQKQNNQ